MKAVSGQDRSFLLLYRSGSEQSECALARIDESGGTENETVFLADVNNVRDIHDKLGVDTAPSLVTFKKDRVVNITKGCQTRSVYYSIISGKEFGQGQKKDQKTARPVIVYTTPTCSWCNTLKTYLDQRNVRYREINVAADTTAAEAMVKKSGQQGVPQTEVDGQMVIGFDQMKLNKLLEIKTN